MTKEFESCAVYKGTQTRLYPRALGGSFESCAVYKGTQTKSMLYNDIRTV